MAMKRQSARMLTEAMVGAGLSKWDAEALVNNFMVRNYRLTKGTIPAQDDMRPFLAFDGKSRFFQYSHQFAS